MKKTAKKTSKPKDSVKSSAHKSVHKSSAKKNSYVTPLLIIVVVLLLIFGFMLKAHKKNQMMVKYSPTGKISASVWLQGELMKGNILTIPEVTPATVISLKQKTTAYGDFENDKTKPFGTVTLGDILAGDTEHIFTTIAVNTGGTGENMYLVAFDSSPEGYKMTASVPLGDRVAVDSVTVDGSTVMISYRDHGPQQAMAEEPSAKMEKKFSYMNGSFTEMK